MTKEHRNRKAGRLSPQRLLLLAQEQPEQSRGPSELPTPAARRPRALHCGHSGPPQAPPPSRALRHARSPCPQLLPPATAPEASPHALRYARGPRRPSTQAVPEQREAAGPSRHALPSASGGPAVSSAARPGPSAGFRGAGRGGAPRRRRRRWWPRGGGRLGCDPRAVASGAQGRPPPFLQAASPLCPKAQFCSLVWFPWLQKHNLEQ